MLPRDTNYHQLRYQYIKILNTIRKQNQIGAGASEAQLPGDANSSNSPWVTMVAMLMLTIFFDPWSHKDW